MAPENQKSVAMKVVEKVEKQAAIKKVVNRKYSKTQPVPKCIFDEGFMDEYYMSMGRFIKSVWTVFYIIPALMVGLLEGLSQGLLKGLQKVTTTYEKQVNKYPMI